MPRFTLRVLSMLLLAALAAGCQRAAELIPGEATIAPTGTTPTPVVSQPILPPGTIDLGSADASTPTVPDAELAASVVQVEALDPPAIPRNGSGVVVDTDLRLVLTSYQLVNPYAANGSAAYQTLAIGRVAAPGDESAPEFQAEIVAADPAVDLAVVRVSAHLDGSPIESGSFDLPAVTIPDTATIARGDVLRLFGHPGLATGGPGVAQPVMATEAAVLGFRGDAAIDGRAWIRTDARLPYGHTGGPAFDAAGRLVGIEMQVQYAQGAEVGQVRPIALARSLIEAARRAGPATVYHAPLYRRLLVPVTGDGVVVSVPAFAGSALEEPEGGDLFDYTNALPDGQRELHYEYALQGVQPGDVVEERWYLNGVLQDGLSTSLAWSGPSFELVSDRLESPTERGLQPGVWRLEVWVREVLRASASVTIGTSGTDDAAPVVDNLRFANLATSDQGPAGPPSGESDRLLAFFDYQGASAARELRWVVFKDGSPIYESPSIRWAGGSDGTWWVGYVVDDGTLGRGRFEFEIYIDNERVVVGGVDLS